MSPNKLTLRVQAPLGNAYRWLATRPLSYGGAVSVAAPTQLEAAWRAKSAGALLELRARG